MRYACTTMTTQMARTTEHDQAKPASTLILGAVMVAPDRLLSGKACHRGVYTPNPGGATPNSRPAMRA